MQNAVRQTKHSKSVKLGRFTMFQFEGKFLRNEKNRKENQKKIENLFFFLGQINVFVLRFLN